MPPDPRQYQIQGRPATEETLQQINGKLPQLTDRRIPVAATLPPSALSAFGWIRIADPVGIFESSLAYDLEPNQWETIVAGSGAVTHRPLKSTAELSTGGGVSGALCARQSRPYSRYQPGKGQLILQSFVLGAPKAGVRRRIGYFDAAGGIFLEQTATALRIVRRTKVSGVVVDNPIESTAWNGSIDPTKCCLMYIAFEWLGVGKVDVGFASATTGELVSATTFYNAQVLDTVWTTTASLPCRIEIENTGTASGASTIDQICTAVISEGGFESPKGYGATANNGTTPVAVTTRRPVLSIRHALTFPTASAIANRVSVETIEAEIRATSNDAFWELVIGGTLTGAAFTDIDATNSCMQRDSSASAIAGGAILDSGYVTAGTGTTAGRISHELARKAALALDAAGTTPMNLSIVATSMSGTSNLTAAMRWKELR